MNIVKKHPELVRLASVRCRLSVEKLIYDAVLAQRFCDVGFAKIYDRFIYLDEVPQFVEDYALKLLAKQEREARETCLLNGYEQWRKR